MLVDPIFNVSTTLSLTLSRKKDPAEFTILNTSISVRHLSPYVFGFPKSGVKHSFPGPTKIILS